MRLFGLVLIGALAALSPTSLSAQNVLIAQQRTRHYANSLAPYVVSPPTVVDRMLELADLKPGETLYDLGSGDGRILFTAAQNFRARAVGIEISDALVHRTEERIQRMHLQDRVRIIHADVRDVDLSPADVVTMYFSTGSNESLRPRLEKYLRSGARVVSHDYAVPGWKADKVDKAEAYSRDHVIYVYVMPPKK